MQQTPAAIVALEAAIAEEQKSDPKLSYTAAMQKVRRKSPKVYEAGMSARDLHGLAQPVEAAAASPTETPILEARGGVIFSAPKQPSMSTTRNGSNAEEEIVAEIQKIADERGLTFAGSGPRGDRGALGVVKRENPELYHRFMAQRYPRTA